MEKGLHSPSFQKYLPPSKQLSLSLKITSIAFHLSLHLGKTPLSLFVFSLSPSLSISFSHFLSHSLSLPPFSIYGRLRTKYPSSFFISHFSSCFSGHYKFPMPYLGYPSSNIPTVPVLVVGFQVSFV